MGIVIPATLEVEPVASCSSTCKGSETLSQKQNTKKGLGSWAKKNGSCLASRRTWVESLELEGKKDVGVY
jgi:hypothetical protein